MTTTASTTPTTATIMKFVSKAGYEYMFERQARGCVEITGSMDGKSYWVGRVWSTGEECAHGPLGRELYTAARQMMDAGYTR